MHVTSSRLRRRTRSERGASLVEYALMLALVAVICVGAVAFLGTSSGSKLKQGAGGGSATDAATTTTVGLGCASVHPDGYATGPGYHTNCYSPTFGPYNV
ncbi:MAG: Flp family type IVb pilin [Aquihabitans sp.]